MNKIEILQSIIEQEGGCIGISCRDCPLGKKPDGHYMTAGCVSMLGGTPYDEVMQKILYAAQQMLHDIAEKMILGINNEQD